MTVLIQNPNTKLYLDQDGGWTPSVSLGRNFESLAAALEECRQSQRDDLNVVLRFRQPNFEMTLSQSDAEKLVKPRRPETARELQEHAGA